MTGALDGTRQLSLVLGAGASLATGTDFTVFGHKAAQDIRLLIIDHRAVIGAEQAHPWVGVKTPRPAGCALGIIWGKLIAHFLLHKI